MNYSFFFSFSRNQTATLCLSSRGWGWRECYLMSFWLQKFFDDPRTCQWLACSSELWSTPHFTIPELARIIQVNGSPHLSWFRIRSFMWGDPRAFVKWPVAKLSTPSRVRFSIAKVGQGNVSTNDSDRDFYRRGLSNFVTELHCWFSNVIKSTTVSKRPIPSSLFEGEFANSTQTSLAHLCEGHVLLVRFWEYILMGTFQVLSVHWWPIWHINTMLIKSSHFTSSTSVKRPPVLRVGVDLGRRIQQSYVFWIVRPILFFFFSTSSNFLPIFKSWVVLYSCLSRLLTYNLLLAKNTSCQYMWQPAALSSFNFLGNI